MKFATLCATIVTVGFGMAGAIPDLTNASASTFKANSGKIVSIQGKLQDGMPGYSVWNRTEKVPFYVVPDVPPGGFTFPKTWQELLGHQVRVTGELKYEGYYHGHGPRDQSFPDYYFMVLQKTKIDQVAIPSSIAERPGADQPATKPTDMTPAKVQSPPHTTKDAPK